MEKPKANGGGEVKVMQRAGRKVEEDDRAARLAAKIASKSKGSAEEREKDYLSARARIFNQDASSPHSSSPVPQSDDQGASDVAHTASHATATDYPSAPAGRGFTAGRGRGSTDGAECGQSPLAACAPGPVFKSAGRGSQAQHKAMMKSGHAMQDPDYDRSKFNRQNQQQQYMQQQYMQQQHLQQMHDQAYMRGGAAGLAAGLNAGAPDFHLHSYDMPANAMGGGGFAGGMMGGGTAAPAFVGQSAGGYGKSGYVNAYGYGLPGMPLPSVPMPYMNPYGPAAYGGADLGASAQRNPFTSGGGGGGGVGVGMGGMARPVQGGPGDFEADSGGNRFGAQAVEEEEGNTQRAPDLQHQQHQGAPEPLPPQEQVDAAIFPSAAYQEDFPAL